VNQPPGDQLNVFTSAWAQTDLATLRLPEPPGPLASRVHQLGERRAGTRQGAPGLASPLHFAEEAAEWKVDDYVLAGVEDVSIDLDGLYFHVVFGPVAVFSQTILDSGSLSPKGRRLFDAYSELAEIASALPQDSFPPPPARLVVMDFEYGPSEWHWTGPQPAQGLGGIHGALSFALQLARSG
jgi:hypothetical protein